MANDPDDPRWTPVMLRRELLARGESPKSIAALVRSRTLRRIRHGAYVDAACWSSMSPEHRHAVRARAAVRQAKAPVALSHTSALIFHGAPVWGLDLDDVHLQRLDGKAGRSEAGLRQHRGELVEGDLVEIADVTLTSPTRTALEMTRIASLEQSVVIMSALLHERLTTTSELRSRNDSMTRWPGSLKTDLAIRLSDGRLESVAESRVWFLMWEQGLPQPVPQYEVRDDDGSLLARLDFALPKYGVWIEFDGRVKYDDLRREGETPVDVVMREKRREQRVMERTGWICVRITWADLARPAELARRIRAAMALGRRTSSA